MDDLYQAEQKAPEPSRKIKVIATLLTILVIALVVGVVITVEGAGWNYLTWAKHHPALVAKYDPHHWLARIAVLIIVLSFCRTLIHAALPPWATFNTWRRVFLPLPWELRERPEQVGTEPPMRQP